MKHYSQIENRLIDEEIDLQLLLDFLKAKPFAISPPIEVENSFIMGLVNDHLELCSGLAISGVVVPVWGRGMVPGTRKRPRISPHKTRQR